MKIRTPLLAAAMLALPLAACGDDKNSSTTTVAVPGDNTPVPPEGADGSGYQHPTGADEVVLSIGYEGGFVPVDYQFTRTPVLLVAGDGAVYVPGVTTLEYPGPLVMPTERRQLTEEGIQALLALAEEKGLLAQPGDYARNDQIADAPDTVVVITVGGETFRHQAYALGMDPSGEESDSARKALAEFVEAATALSVVPEGSLSDGELLTGDLEIRATEVDAANYEEPTVTPWASDGGLALADAGECLVVPASDAAATALLVEGKQNSLFTEGDVTYQIAVRPQLPGGPAC